MAHASTTRSDYVQALPKLNDAAQFIGLDPSGMTRAIQRLEIEPERWGGRDKHLAIADVLTIAANAQRASLEEVAGNILTWAEMEHAEHVDAFTAEIDAFFAALPAPAGASAGSVCRRAARGAPQALGGQGRGHLALRTPRTLRARTRSSRRRTRPTAGRDGSRAAWRAARSRSIALSRTKPTRPRPIVRRSIAAATQTRSHNATTYSASRA